MGWSARSRFSAEFDFAPRSPSSLGLSSIDDPGLIADQLYVVLRVAMTKQDIQEYYGQSVYQIQMNVATQAFVQMVCNQPVETAFPEMAVLAMNAAKEFTATVLASPKPN
jgi:hypothetical protein